MKSNSDPATSDPVIGSHPTSADLERAVELLGLPVDPVYLYQDHPESRRRAELLARIAAAVVDELARSEALADLGVDDRADLHWAADCEVATVSRPSPDSSRLLDLQLARLGWVHHAMLRGRGERPHQVAETVTTTIGALIQLVEAWRDGAAADRSPVTGRPGRQTDPIDPMLADALKTVRDSAYHLAGVLRWCSRRTPLATPIGH